MIGAISGSGTKHGKNPLVAELLSLVNINADRRFYLEISKD